MSFAVAAPGKPTGLGRLIALTTGAVFVLLTLYVLSSGPTAALVTRYDADWWDSCLCSALAAGRYAFLWTAPVFHRLVDIPC